MALYGMSVSKPAVPYYNFGNEKAKTAKDLLNRKSLQPVHLLLTNLPIAVFLALQFL